MQTNLSDDVAVVLSKIGPALSSTLARALQDELNISSAAARKRIERAKIQSAIKALSGLVLKHKEQFLFTEEQEHDSAKFRISLWSALRGSRYGTVIDGLAARGGATPLDLYPAISGLPIEKIDGFSATDALSQLLEWRLIDVGATKAGECVWINELILPTHPSEQRILGRLTAEQLLLIALREWLQNQGLVTAKASTMRNQSEEKPQFGHFQFDFVAPSYVAALCAYRNQAILPGFVVADVIIGRRLDVDDVQYFISKCSAIKNKPNNRPFLAWLIADWFEQEALAIGKKHGLIFTTPKNIFGIPFRNALDSIVQIIENKDRTYEKLESVANVFTSIGHLVTTFAALKDTIFLLLMAHVYDEKSITTDLSVKVAFEKSSAEVDLIVTFDDRLIAMECKNSATVISLESVVHWFSNVVPSLHRVLAGDSKFSKVKQFEYCFTTSGTFTPEASSFVTQVGKNVPYSVTLKDGADVERLLYQKPMRVQELYKRLFHSTSSIDRTPQADHSYESVNLPNTETRKQRYQKILLAIADDYFQEINRLAELTSSTYSSILRDILIRASSQNPLDFRNTLRSDFYASKKRLVMLPAETLVRISSKASEVGWKRSMLIDAAIGYYLSERIGRKLLPQNELNEQADFRNLC